ncbi:protein associated with UVRAG as autophagy enhancer [Salminus brasiliensis]|uniref:protein associated with UVRAG as autophagy enhancer n=1 Tax=Salminus brasiliensis TaxID=930266 RepID=UPI003B82EB76
MVDQDSRSIPSRMKPMFGSTDSVIVSSPDSNHGDSCEFALQSGSEMIEDDHSRSQDPLKPRYGCSSPTGWTSVSSCELDLEQEWYHLPRSSPVISRKARFRASEGIELQPSEGSSAISLSSTPPFQNRTSSASTRSVLSNTREPPVGYVDASSALRPSQMFPQAVPPPQQVTVLEDSDEQDSSESQSPLESRGLSLSDGMVQHLNGSPRQGKKNRASSDAPLISGPVNEKQISEDLYRNSMDLDQENAHFVVVDMVLEVLEAVKWSVSQQKLKLTGVPEDTETPRNSKTHSFTFSDSGYDDYCGRRFSSNRSSWTSVRRSLKTSRCSAEGLAQRLLTELRKQWVLSEQPFSCEKPGLTLEEFPLETVSMVTGGGVRLSEEIRMRSRMRGTLTWAPPRFQIIFNVQPTQRRSDVIAAQHFLCAGCGTEVEPRYIKRLRYCEYLGRYFCDSCHSSAESVIPGRVLSRWDFGRYPVCGFSKQLLDSIWEQPLFNLSVVAKSLYGQAKEMQRFRELQEQLISIKKLLRACRLSDGVLTDFQQLPSHLTEELHLFSMDDLGKVKRGQLLTAGKAVLRTAAAHVEACELCQAKGFICEFCRGPDVLFPFQTDVCTRCHDCRACFHTACFRDEQCPRCARLQIRKSLQSAASL